MDLNNIDVKEIVERVTKEVYARIGSAGLQNLGAPPLSYSITDIAAAIEHSLLNPDTSREKMLQGCAEAKKHRLGNVCVTPFFAADAAQALAGTGIPVCVPVGFPHGAASTAAKVAEIREAILNGAGELDVSLNIVAIKSGDMDAAKKDLDAMVSAAGGRAKVKAIFEQGLFTEDEKVKVLLLSKQAGVDYIKISNALTGKKAVVEDVKYVRSIIGKGIGIKIDGGVKDAATVCALLAAGANRIGASASVKIVTQG
jgi:deoxyribose-phosphate aldolase